MIEGKTVNLRSWCEGDVGKLTELRNDIRLQSQLLSRVRGSNTEQTRRWLEERSGHGGNLFFVVTEKKNNDPAGYLQFVDLDPIDQTTKLGICLAPEIQGKGMGYEVLSIALKYLSDYWAIRKVILEVREDNHRAIRCYEKLGFSPCGKYLQHKYLDGAWHDVLMMELFLDPAGKSR